MSDNMSEVKLLFIGKAGNFYSEAAAEFVTQHFKNATIYFSRRKDPFPDELRDWRGDLIISYLSQWIIPSWLLNSAEIAAINLHPGPPDYPGIGCTNFAIYNDEKDFGITCHHMLGKVDSGKIIFVKRFPILDSDTVYSLTQRCYIEILHSFLDLMTRLLKGEPFPESDEKWARKPYTRKELDELCLLRHDMSIEERNKRIKATTFGKEIWAKYVNKEGQITSL